MRPDSAILKLPRLAAIAFWLLGSIGCSPPPEATPGALRDMPGVELQPASRLPSTAAVSAPAALPVTLSAATRVTASAESLLGPSEFVQFFASPTTDGWRFPTPYHFHEWRLAAKLRGSPRFITDAAGITRKLYVGWAAPRIVILIDDLGNARAPLRTLEALPFIVNGAVLPHTPNASFATEQIMRAGGDVLLHLPLQPLTFPADNPGPGALWVTMPAESRAKVFAEDWGSVPGVIGFNNHMGSRFTSDPEAMAQLATLSRGIATMFVDSRTIAHSVAARQMLANRIPSLGRTHFLDDLPGDEAVSQRLDEAIRYAQRNGIAVAIGHPNRSTLRVLSIASERFVKAGVTPVPLRQIFELK